MTTPINGTFIDQSHLIDMLNLRDGLAIDLQILGGGITPIEISTLSENAAEYSDAVLLRRGHLAQFSDDLNA